MGAAKRGSAGKLARQSSRKGLGGAVRSDYEEMQVMYQFRAVEKMKSMCQVRCSAQDTACLITFIVPACASQFDP